ncbi:hypothetical protein [Pseudoduganella plicata]|uniref:Uncharacterized protein n=1 Tax=Pseudoduganella plicata TaxID=321984 RepID=A0ABX5SC76_9BURK|nr:hypothetical protein [Pseudoduganella plicata]QBQ36859.1 hypothetical protein E1742_12290 [Pseudoduganella plicata]
MGAGAGGQLLLPAMPDEGGDQLGPLVDALALECARAGGAGTSVELLVSDALARSVALPWQDQLLSPEQLPLYAQACFERAGVEVDDGWAVHCGFRHFGRPGLAVAIPKAWLGDAASRMAAHGLRLNRVTPVTAAAYWRQPTGIRRTVGLLLLAEPGRLTALRSVGGKFEALEVEPAGGDPVVPLRRLLRRSGTGAPPATVQIWQSQAGMVDSALVAQHFAAARIRTLATDAWSR